MNWYELYCKLTTSHTQQPFTLFLLSSVTRWCSGGKWRSLHINSSVWFSPTQSGNWHHTTFVGTYQIKVDRCVLWASCMDPNATTFKILPRPRTSVKLQLLALRFFITPCFHLSESPGRRHSSPPRPATPARRESKKAYWKRNNLWPLWMYCRRCDHTVFCPGGGCQAGVWVSCQGAGAGHSWNSWHWLITLEEQHRVHRRYHQLCQLYFLSQ